MAQPAPKKHYDAVIVGGGGHGLATAYYLAKNHGMRNVAVIEKGWLGGGNTGRNTTIVRSNYHLDPNAHFYEFSLKLWESLSQRAQLQCHVQRARRAEPRAFAGRHGRRDAPRQRDAPERHRRRSSFRATQIARWIPNLDCSANARFPILGGLLQPRGGTVRHDAVAWGYARAADALGVDIIQQCEVTGIRVERGAVAGVDTSHGFIGTPKIGIAVAGHSGHVAAMAGMQPADRIARAAGDGVGAGQADARYRRDFGRRAFLRQPVRQGRAGDGRRSRFLQLVCAARQSARHRARHRGVPCACFRASGG